LSFNGTSVPSQVDAVNPAYALYWDISDITIIFGRKTIIYNYERLFYLTECLIINQSNQNFYDSSEKMRLTIISSCSVALLMSTVVHAAETTTYTYDELGRLVASSNSGGPRNGRQTTISLDPAGNRKAYASGLPLPPQTNSAVFSISGATPVDEGGAAIFTITKTGTASTVMTVNLATVNGSAVANVDYTPVSVTLSFLPSETVKQFSVTTLADQVAEPSEQFSAALSSPSAGGTLGTASALATINSSAGPPPPNLPPVANPDPPTLQVRCGQYASRDVVSNDTDPDGDYPLSLISLSGSGSSFAILESPSTIGFSAPYTRNTLYSVVYTIRDARGETATGTLAISVIGTVAECSGGQQAQPPAEGG
jgi:YD repeat-containing protein